MLLGTHPERKEKLLEADLPVVVSVDVRQNLCQFSLGEPQSVRICVSSALVNLSPSESVSVQP